MEYRGTTKYLWCAPMSLFCDHLGHGRKLDAAKNYVNVFPKMRKPSPHRDPFLETHLDSAMREENPVSIDLTATFGINIIYSFDKKP